MPSLAWITMINHLTIGWPTGIPSIIGPPTRTYPLVNWHGCWKWPFFWWIYPLNLVMFHGFFSMFAREYPKSRLGLWDCKLPLCLLDLKWSRDHEANIHSQASTEHCGTLAPWVWECDNPYPCESMPQNMHIMRMTQEFDCGCRNITCRDLLMETHWWLSNDCNWKRHLMGYSLRGVVSNRDTP